MFLRQQMEMKPFVYSMIPITLTSCSRTFRCQAMLTGTWSPIQQRAVPGPAVIYMTGNPSSLRNTVGTRDAFIRKPFSPSKVLVIVEGLLSPH